MVAIIPSSNSFGDKIGRFVVHEFGQFADRNEFIHFDYVGRFGLDGSGRLGTPMITAFLFANCQVGHGVLKAFGYFHLVDLFVPFFLRRSFRRCFF